MKIPARWFAPMVVLVLGVGFEALAAEPVINIPSDAAQGALLDTQRQQIDQYVAYQIDQMAKATTEKAVTTARSKLIDSYNRYGTKAEEYMAAFASSMTKNGKGLLAGLSQSDPLETLKAVNFSLATSKMSQVTIEPLAALMVAHADQAVRYFGWETFVSLRLTAIATGGKPAKDMYQAVANQLPKEAEPYVLSELIKMFNFRGAGAVTITPEAYISGQARMYKILQANWVGLCQKLINTNGKVAEACSAAVESTMNLRAGLKGQADDKQIAQMLANMVWSAGKTYDAVLKLKAAATGDSPEIDYAASTTSKLLMDCESALKSLTETGDTYISKALTSSPAALGASVRLATLDWVKKLVEKYSIKQPEKVIPTK